MATEDFIKAIDKNTSMDVIYPYFEKVFDLVQQEWLLVKPVSYGIPKKTLWWINDVITNRKKM